MARRKKLYFIILLAITVALMIAVPVMATLRNRKALAEDDEQMQRITVWQIDGFEGGKGSRSQYLQKVAEKCFKGEKIYVSVTSLSADAARANSERGERPDIISYPACFYGFENYINKKDFVYKTWCRGAYCLLSLDESCDFSDANAQNTVVNAGKDNLTEVAVTLNGLNGATVEESTNAYLKLINGKYKYLFGTQRDIFRLKVRNVPFKVQPLTEFNDLYQNISILTANNEKYEYCNKYIDYLLSKSEVGSLGLFYGDGELCAEELKPLQYLEFNYVLNYPCGAEYINELKSAAKSGDANKIKTLLK
ncbi:MAG: hypothetical protein K2O44_06460 [Clostridia bacterium]|nr:hypothetical protein [Clostridia bacterium]